MTSYPTFQTVTSLGRHCVAILTILKLLLILPGCGSKKDFAETILYNGKVVTVDSKFSIHEAVALKDGKILRVGSTESIMELVGDSSVRIDLEGRTVIPGLIEGHAHPVQASQSEFSDTIPVVSNISEVLAWIRREASIKEDNEWIIHPKFFITRMQDMRQITLSELDAAAPSNPVFLDGSYGGIVNSKALDLSGIRNRHHPGIMRDALTGRPTGLLRSSAFGLLAIPQSEHLDGDQQAEALKKLFMRYNSIGFTSVVSGGGGREEIELFKDLMQRGELTVRVFHNVLEPFDLAKPQEEVTAALKKLGIKTGDGNDWVKVGAFKVEIDGGMLTGTAFLNEGWGKNAKALYGIANPEYRGELRLRKNELVKIINAALQTGWKFTAHVTGGGGVDTLLSAYEYVDKIQPIRDKRFSIIHGNFFSPKAIKMMADLGIYADMQPAWFFKDTRLLDHVLGSERMKAFHPYRSLVDAGVIVNAGADHMVKVDPDKSINPYNPFLAMWSMVTRKTDHGLVYNQEQAISREEALKMYTINNARSSFEENVKGSIEDGKFADLVVLSEDIMTCPEDSIRTIKPVLTMVGGKIVFDSEKLKPTSFTH